MAAKWAWLGFAVTVLMVAGCQRHAETGGGGGRPESGQRTEGVATPSVGRTAPPYVGKPVMTPTPGQPAPTVPPNPKAKSPTGMSRPATPLAPSAGVRNE